MIHDDFAAFFQSLNPAVKIIYANENGTRPPKPYITQQILTGPAMDVHTGAVDDDGNAILSKHRRVSINLQCYGDGSWQIMEDMEMSLNKQAALEAAYLYNIAIGAVPGLTDITLLMDDTTFENRTLLNVIAFYTYQTEDQLGFINTAEGVGESVPESGNIYEDEFTVSVPVL